MSKEAAQPYVPKTAEIEKQVEQSGAVAKIQGRHPLFAALSANGMSDATLLAWFSQATIEGPEPAEKATSAKTANYSNSVVVMDRQEPEHQGSDTYPGRSGSRVGDAYVPPPTTLCVVGAFAAEYIARQFAQELARATGGPVKIVAARKSTDHFHD